MHIQQAERRRRLIYLAQFTAEKRLRVLRPGVRQSLGHMVTIRHRLGQPLRLSTHTGGHFRQHRVQGLVVADEMMCL